MIDTMEIGKVCGRKKKFVRYKEGAKLYGLQKGKFASLAKDAHAIYKIDKLVLVKLDQVNAYLERTRMDGSKE